MTITTDDITDNGDGTFSVGSDIYGLSQSADHCIIKTIDYNAGPIRLNNGNLVILDGRVAYNAAGCTIDDRFIEEIRDQNGGCNVHGLDMSFKGKENVAFNVFHYEGEGEERHRKKDRKKKKHTFVHAK